MLSNQELQEGLNFSKETRSLSLSFKLERGLTSATSSFKVMVDSKAGAGTSLMYREEFKPVHTHKDSIWLLKEESLL